MIFMQSSALNIEFDMAGEAAREVISVTCGSERRGIFLAVLLSARCFVSASVYGEVPHREDAAPRSLLVLFWRTHYFFLEEKNL